MDITEIIFKWLKKYGLLVNAAAGFLAIIAYFVQPPPLTLEQGNPVDFLTKALVILILIFGFFLTLVLNKYYHFKVWLLVSIICLICCFGYFLFDPQVSWVCTYENGERVIMGYDFTPEGEEQLKKPICRGCEALIYDCGHGKPDRIWTTQSIAWIRRFLFVAYFSIIPFVVFFYNRSCSSLSVSFAAKPEEGSERHMVGANLQQ